MTPPTPPRWSCTNESKYSTLTPPRHHACFVRVKAFVPLVVFGTQLEDYAYECVPMATWSHHKFQAHFRGLLAGVYDELHNGTVDLCCPQIEDYANKVSRGASDGSGGRDVQVRCVRDLTTEPCAPARPAIPLQSSRPL